MIDSKNGFLIPPNIIPMTMKKNCKVNKNLGIDIRWILSKQNVEGICDVISITSNENAFHAMVHE